MPVIAAGHAIARGQVLLSANARKSLKFVLAAGFEPIINSVLLVDA